MEDIAQEFIMYARQFASNNLFGKAFDFYIKAFEKCPGVINQHEPEFHESLNKFNDFLYADSNMEDILKNFAETIKFFPENAEILNEIGKYMYKYGLYDEAWIQFQKALDLDLVFVNPEKNLNSVKNLLVPRWHYRMLNDKVRNVAYHDAICDNIKPFIDTVLDLGSGTSILSMYASECCPAFVTAVECSKLMAQLSKAIIQYNGLIKVKVINKNSNILNCIDIAGKKSLAVTEMFDAGLFGEHILDTMIHAWKHLISSDGKVIPMCAEFYVVPIQSDCLNRRYQLSSHIKSVLNIQDLNVHVLTNDEPYDCEDIYFFKDLKYLATPKSLLHVDFNDRKDLQEKKNQTEPFTANFTMTESGELNSVVGWFALHLTDRISITTDPRCPDKATAWQQAVFFDNIPRNVTKAEKVTIDFLLNGGKLTMVPDNKVKIDRISPEALRFLNDTNYINTIMSSIGVASVYLGQIADMSQLNIADLCPFPIFGLLMLLRGANSLICYAKTTCDNEFIKKIFQANNVDISKVTILVGDEWTTEAFEMNKYHAIFCNILELCGDIDVRLNNISQTLKESYLLPGGLFMPSDIKVIGQLVSSRWLDLSNRVYDYNIGIFEVAKYMNMYQVSQNFCVDFNHLEYTPIADPIVFGSINSEIRSELVHVPISSTCTGNAILCWYSIELLEETKEVLTNSPTTYIDGLVFMLHKNVPFVGGEVTNLTRWIDQDRSFKILIDDD